MHAKKLLLLLLLLIALFSYSQAEKKIALCDSLFLEILKQPADSLLLMDLTAAMYDLSSSHPDTVSYYAEQLYNLSKREDFYPGIATALNLQGMMLEQSNYPAAIAKYEQCLGIAKENNLWNLAASVYNNLSIVYSLMGEYSTSIDYLLELLSLAESQHDTMRMAVALNNIGLRYHEMKSPGIALDYFRNAMRYNLIIHDTAKYATNLSNIGVAFQALELYDSAFYYHQKAIGLHRQNHDLYKMQYSYQALVYLYLDKNEIGLAAANLDTALDLAHQVNDQYGILNLMVAQGDLLNRKKKHTAALQVLNETQQLALEMNYRSILVDVYKELSKAYQGIDDYKHAFEYNEKYISLRDSLQNIEKSKSQMSVNAYVKEKSDKEIELFAKNIEIQKLQLQRQKQIRNLVMVIGALFLAIALLLLHRYRYAQRTRRELESKNRVITHERQRSDDLLLNILPSETAEELKNSGTSKARKYNQVTVLFTDFKGFVQMAGEMEPEALVAEIDYCYKHFDDIITQHHVEKIKTIGDSYMCAAGLPLANTTNPVDAVRAACAIRRFMEEYKQQRQAAGMQWFDARIGLHTGPVVAGIVGNRKFAYDIWGDTVNIASRMESGGEVGKINISRATWLLVKDHFQCTPRGQVEVKNGLSFEMYFVEEEVESER
ncbi:MAG: adenylate/guanylate cyclase domain-containing protein [Bacteroidales bacterium]|nr:adenylate/guanylate cyclase domain-containing protein [Bacteroidales bacterium]MDD4740104.1 adenylate/guanylate cyclase domain-containing protein [Bacteroidales bacterium]